mmetsp:Transcript_71359/g.163559  ORF Transcript_71359/g.163559 Transcript_71359/m.163559 type:complete len:306 (+) Transcript_71359:378-1295(+)
MLRLFAVELAAVTRVVDVRSRRLRGTAGHVLVRLLRAVAAVLAAPGAEVAGAPAALEGAAAFEVEEGRAAARALGRQYLLLHMLPRRENLALPLVERAEALQLGLNPALGLLLHLLAHAALQQPHPPLHVAVEDRCRDSLPQLRVAEGRGRASKLPPVRARHPPFPLPEQSQLLPRAGVHVPLHAPRARQVAFGADGSLRVPLQLEADAAVGGLLAAEREQRLEERVVCCRVCARALRPSIRGQHSHQGIHISRGRRTLLVDAPLAELREGFPESEHVRGSRAAGLLELGGLEASSPPHPHARRD